MPIKKETNEAYAPNPNDKTLLNLIILCSLCERNPGTQIRVDELNLKNLVCAECADLIDRGIDPFSLRFMYRME